MTVYIYLLPTVNKVKIGFSHNLKNRIKSLATGSFENGKIIRVFPDYGNLGEAYLHKKYKHLRTHGEWFEYADEMLVVEIPPNFRQFGFKHNDMPSIHGLSSQLLETSQSTALTQIDPNAYSPINFFDYLESTTKNPALVLLSTLCRLKDPITNLSIIESSSITQTERNRVSKGYSELKERGLVLRIKPHVYLLNPRLSPPLPEYFDDVYLRWLKLTENS